MDTLNEEESGKEGCNNGDDSASQNCKVSASSGLNRLAAIFRGNRSRTLHVSRMRASADIVCPFVKCSDKVIEQVLQVLLEVHPNMGTGDVVYDLGSGDGSVIVSIAARFRCKCIGVELDAMLCKMAQRKTQEMDVTSCVTIMNQEIEKTNINDASVIFIFLVPSCMECVTGMIKKQCKPGTILIFYNFPPPEWTPVKIVSTENCNVKNTSLTSNIYVYITQ